MMLKRCSLFVLLFVLTLAGAKAQVITDSIGEAKLVNCKVIKRQNKTQTVNGTLINTTELTIEAESYMQVSCNFIGGTYETLKHKIKLTYAEDHNNVIYDTILKGIREYYYKQQAWSDIYLKGNGDFFALPYYKSFYTKGDTIVPYLSTGPELPGDYQILYHNKKVYKIESIKRSKGLGSISTFMVQNILFGFSKLFVTEGAYLKTLDKVNALLVKLGY